jgi:hypothetical protein
MSSRNKGDEELLRLIGMCNESVSNVMGYVDIFDARPLLNARTNKIVSGGGYEDCGPDGAYSNCSLVFGDIDNIHVVRESFEKVYDMAYNVTSTERSKASGWNSILDNSGYKHVLTRIMSFTNDMLTAMTVK